MWQPNRTQWSIIWTVTVVLVLAWPARKKGQSLGVKALNLGCLIRRESLPVFPEPLPMSMDDLMETPLPPMIRWKQTTFTSATARR